MLVVENDENEELLKDALSRHPYVKYFEEDVEFHVDSDPADQNAVTYGSAGNNCGGLNADSSVRTGAKYCISNPSPSALEMSPWFRDVLGMNGANNANPANDIAMSAGDDKTIVAVIDTGAMVQHPFLKNAILLNTAEKNGTANVDNDGNGVVGDIYGASFTLNSSDQLVASGDPTDNGTDHGTHVAGIIKAVRDQAIAYYGTSSTAPRTVQILPIRFINESQVGTTSGAIAALDYAARRGAKVVNCSWGAKGTESFTQSLFDAMAEAYTQHDILIAIASGNAERYGPNNNDETPYFPSSMSVPSIISVASVTPEYRSSSQPGGSLYTLGMSDFSNYGAKSVHIAAPGGYRDQSGYSEGIYSSNARLWDSEDIPYVKKKGTSMATPVVAGVAAVVRALNPGLTSYEVKKLLMDTVGFKSSALSAASVSGGVLNAASAYAAAQTRVTTGEKPLVPSSPYVVYSGASSSPAPSESDSGGGCGALVALGEGSRGGPFGGNSLILFSAIYYIGYFIRSTRRRIKRGRV